MYVVDVPEDDPIVKVEKDLADVGDVVAANCTTPSTFPAANISWYLNGQKIGDLSTMRKTPKNDSIHRKRYVTYSDIKIEINEKTFQDGKAILSCVATIFDSYKAEQKVVIEETKPKPRPSSVMSYWDESSGSNSAQSPFYKLLAIAVISQLLYR